MPRQRRQPTNTQHLCQTPSTNSKDASACRLRRRRPRCGGVYRGDLCYLSTASRKFFDVFLTAFHKPPDFHVFVLYYGALIAPPALGRALNRPYCPNSFCRIFETSNRRALRGDCGYRCRAGLSLTYVSSAGKTHMPVWEPSDRMEDTLIPDWRLSASPTNDFKHVRAVSYKEGPATAV